MRALARTPSRRRDRELDAGGSGRQRSGEKLQQYRRRHGLDEVGVETRLLRPLAVFVLGPSGERNEQHILAPWLLPDPARDVVAVQARHARDRAPSPRGLKRAANARASSPLAAHRGSCPASLSSTARALAASALSSAIRTRRAVLGAAACSSRGTRGIGEAEGSASPGSRTIASQPCPDPSAVDLDGAAVQLDEVARQGEADAEPARPCAPGSGRPGRTCRRAAAAPRARRRCRRPRRVTTTASPSRSAVTRMWPSGFVYLTAFVSRFKSTCVSRIPSASQEDGLRRAGRRSAPGLRSPAIGTHPPPP